MPKNVFFKKIVKSKMYFSRKSQNQKCKHILDSILVENVSQGILNESAECSDRTPTLSLQSFLQLTIVIVTANAQAYEFLREIIPCIEISRNLDRILQYFGIQESTS